MGSTDWSAGYVTDISYIEGFTKEISPSWLNYVAAISGAVPRDISKGFNYIELGCGLGMSTAILAGAFPKGNFYGVDFNPAHIDVANRNAQQWGIDNVQFIERSFDQLLAMDLPEFDFITLHGVYVWVDSDIQAAIRRFIKAKLKPGGIAYISYNCLPGWTMDAPIRKWLYEFAGTVPGDSLVRVRHAVAELQKANELASGYFKVGSNSVKQLDLILKQRPQYVAHEYLNDCWQIPYSIDVADQMQEAKLNFAGSATLLENTLEFVMTKEAAQYVRSLPTPRLRQLVGDFFSFRRFRRDVFIRGYNHLAGEAVIRNVREQLVGLIKPVNEISEKIKLPLGEMAINDPSLPIIKEEVQKGIQTIGEIEAKVSNKLGKRSQTERIISMLAAADILMPAAQPMQLTKMPSQVKKVSWKHPANKVIAQSSLMSARPMFLVNPFLGNGWVVEPVTAAVISVMDGKQNNINDLKTKVEEKLKSHNIQIQDPPSDRAGGSDGKGTVTALETSPEKRLEQAISLTMQRLIPLLHQVGLLDVT